MFHQLDVQDPVSVASLAIFVHLCFGKLDILVNNAGAPGVSVDIKGLRALNLDAESWESVSLECHKWRTKGVDIDYVVRDNRKGYKAGALHEGMKKDYVQECDYVTMFDADFQPDSDYLKKTIPFLAYYPEIALVQAWWKFGTAGVWRISAIHDAGRWNDRTTVEDMDLSVRAGLKGWKFVYVGDIKVKNELPSTFKAYRFQQHRWSCGPANLFKKMAFEIITNKKVSFWKKFYVLYSFFFVGKIVAHTVTFIFSCVIIPISVFVPEVEIPYWGAVYVPALITLCKSVNPQFYAFRWITLLLTQEFNFADSIHIWDTLLSDPEGHQETLLRICCAMLILVRKSLLAGDFTSNSKDWSISYPYRDVCWSYCA